MSQGKAHPEDSGEFLYDGRIVDLAILAALSEITGHQNKPTSKQISGPHNFLYYMATHPKSRSI